MECPPPVCGVGLKSFGQSRKVGSRKSGVKMERTASLGKHFDLFCDNYSTADTFLMILQIIQTKGRVTKNTKFYASADLKAFFKHCFLNHP